MAEKSALSGPVFSSPAKRYKIDRKKIVMDDFDTEASAQLCGELCIRWDLSIRRSMTSDIYMSNPV